MKTILSLGLALVFACGCTTVPAAKKSDYLVTEGAGVLWGGAKDGEACSAFIDLRALPSAPDVMYLEAAFPDPSRPGRQEYIRKEFRKADVTLHIEGSKLSGWENGKTYTYLVVVYADSTYKTAVDVHAQRSRYFAPWLYLRK
jgi:hypothetical protein